ncbi:hypothetical protein PENSPDRAFT_748469 [Peniophora sp. CONT]|nr:hypothetical protein PENSPDRAFT_748469 [Peniophora sp. CONT]
MASPGGPPRYILVSHSSQSPNCSASVKTLSHPYIHYQYADDPPLSLLPSSPSEQVIVLDYDPSGRTSPRAQSISGPAAVTGVKVTDAPGHIPTGEDASWNDKMFVVHTTSLDESRRPSAQASSTEDPQAILTRFRERNAVLRQVLEYQAPILDF